MVDELMTASVLAAEPDMEKVVMYLARVHG